ncbi:hypothetical protein DFH09DRAFT_1417116 [Mycena vulgaris]|nr:hypothetical protein DFH09DRAFT_1417116 [Mycena vulgaris]
MLRTRFTHFVNTTQQSAVSVVEYFNPLNTAYKSGIMDFYHEGGTRTAPAAGVSKVSFAPGIGPQVHLLLMADAFTSHLTGLVVMTGHTGVSSTTLLTETNLFPSIASPSTQTAFPGLNISSSITNVSLLNEPFYLALEELVANATLSSIFPFPSNNRLTLVGFIQLGTSYTAVTASVPSTDNAYLYNRTTLAVTYLLSFVFLLLTGIIGMHCLSANGEVSSNDFSHVLVATRNPKLDPVADILEVDPGPSSQSAACARLVFGEVDVPQSRIWGSF